MEGKFEVEFEQVGEVAKLRTDVGVIGEIVLDSRNVAPEKRGGNASVMLVSAAMTCYCAALTEALEDAKIPFKSIKATGHGLKAPNEAGHMRIRSIDVDTFVDVEDAYADKLALCLANVQSCMIASTLADGVKVKYNTKRLEN